MPKGFWPGLVVGLVLAVTVCTNWHDPWFRFALGGPAPVEVPKHNAPPKDWTIYHREGAGWRWSYPGGPMGIETLETKQEAIDAAWRQFEYEKHPWEEVKTP